MNEDFPFYIEISMPTRGLEKFFAKDRSEALDFFQSYAKFLALMRDTIAIGEAIDKINSEVKDKKVKELILNLLYGESEKLEQEIEKASNVFGKYEKLTMLD